jgi:hypothetical protein
MLREISLDTSLECLLANKVSNHADDRCSFGIRDRVKDLVNLVGMVDFDLDRMGRCKRIEAQCRAVHLKYKLCPNVELGKELVDCQVLHVSRKTLRPIDHQYTAHSGI